MTKQKTKSVLRKFAAIRYIVKYIRLSIRPLFFVNTRYRLLERVPDADAAIHVCSECYFEVSNAPRKRHPTVLSWCAWSFRFIYETLARLIYNGIIDTLIDVHIHLLYQLYSFVSIFERLFQGHTYRTIIIQSELQVRVDSNKNCYY